MPRITGRVLDGDKLPDARENLVTPKPHTLLMKPVDRGSGGTKWIVGFVLGRAPR